jgi:heptosyltransferase-3
MRITLIHDAALGDTILLSPLLRTLRIKFNRPRLTLVTKPDYGQLLRSLKEVDSVGDAGLQSHSRWFAPDADTSPSWAPDSDLLISFVTNGEDDWMANARKNCRAKAIHVVQPKPPGNYRDHVTEWHRTQLAEVDLPVVTMPRAITNSAGPVMIHPGSGSKRKNWPLERFVALATHIRAQKRLVRFILGPAELELLKPSEIEFLEDRFEIIKNPQLADLAVQLKVAHCFIGNDGGVTHLAAWLGITTIALFGPSDPVQWKPFGPTVTALRGEYGTMEDIKLAEVIGVLPPLV